MAPDVSMSERVALWLRRPGNGLLLLSLVSGAVTHGVNMFRYPLYITDEGI